jgi:hypothetical protein
VAIKIVWIQTDRRPPPADAAPNCYQSVTVFAVYAQFLRASRSVFLVTCLSLAGFNSRHIEPVVFLGSSTLSFDRLLGPDGPLLMLMIMPLKSTTTITCELQAHFIFKVPFSEPESPLLATG